METSVLCRKQAKSIHLRGAYWLGFSSAGGHRRARGVISARTVVERRQQVGMLRAIGYQPEMVALSFVLETSFIALVGIAGLTQAVGRGLMRRSEQIHNLHRSCTSPQPGRIIIANAQNTQSQADMAQRESKMLKRGSTVLSIWSVINSLTNASRGVRRRPAGAGCWGAAPTRRPAR